MDKLTLWGPAGPTLHALKGIRYFNGEGGAAGAAGATGADAGGAGAAGAGAAGAGATGGEQKPPWGDDDNFDPKRAWNLISGLRKDVDEEKAKREKAIADAVAKASQDAVAATRAELGKLLMGPEEAETDPAKLNAHITELKTSTQTLAAERDTALAQVKETQTRLQVALLGPALGVDVDKLFTHEPFKTSIASVEPSDRAAIEAAILKAVQETPTLKAPPTRSGSGNHQGATVQDLQAQLAAAEKAGDLTTSIALKRKIAAMNSRAAGA